MLLRNQFGEFSFGTGTATAATPINTLCPPNRRGNTRVTDFNYTPGATTHNLYVMQSQGRTTVLGAAAASQAVATLLLDPGLAVANAVAANDWLAIRYGDGTLDILKVSSVAAGANGAIAVTFTGNIKACVGGEDVWFFGINTDTDPFTGRAFEKYVLTTGSTTDLVGPSGLDYFVGGHASDTPVLLQVDNLTNAGTRNKCLGCYTLN